MRIYIISPKIALIPKPFLYLFQTTLLQDLTGTMSTGNDDYVGPLRILIPKFNKFKRKKNQVSLPNNQFNPICLYPMYNSIFQLVLIIQIFYFVKIRRLNLLSTSIELSWFNDNLILF